MNPAPAEQTRPSLPALSEENQLRFYDDDILKMAGKTPWYVEALVVKGDSIVSVGTHASFTPHDGAHERFNLNTGIQHLTAIPH